jgi:hypothetical protein
MGCLFVGSKGVGSRGVVEANDSVPDRTGAIQADKARWMPQQLELPFRFWERDPPRLELRPIPCVEIVAG